MLLAWLGVAPTRLASLQVLQNRCLRLISGHDRDVSIVQLHEDLDFELLFLFLIRQARKFYQGTILNHNRFISDWGAYDPRDFRARRMPLFFVA